MSIDDSASSLSLPTTNELKDIPVDPVVIKMTKPLADDSVTNTSFHVSPAGTAVLTIADVGSFHISRNQITIHPFKKATPQALGAFLLGSAIGAVLHLRGVFTLHGSTVRKPDGTAAIFCGHSGAGKSTIISALAQQGYACLADDVTAVTFDEAGKAWAQPGLPRAKLWQDSLNQLNMVSNDEIWPGMNKFYVDLPVHEHAIPLTSLYEIEVSDKKEPFTVSQSIEGLDRISTLVMHTYRPSFVLACNQVANHMLRVKNLATQLQMTKILRPRGTNTLNNMRHFIDQSWRQA